MRLNRNGFVRLLTRHPNAINELRNQIETPHDVCLRLGSTTPSNNEIQINTVQSVVNSSDKLLMKSLFNGDYTPDYWFWDGDSWGGMNDEGLLESITYPVLTKLQFRSQGAGMNKHDNADSLRPQLADIKRRYTEGLNQKYIERFHNYSKEYGIHVALDECFYACRKARISGRTEYYRNSDNCVWFTQYDDNNIVKEDFKIPANWDDIVEECNRLRKLVGLDITRMDVIVASNGRFKILECNSAPSIAPGTGVKYREMIPKIINSKLNV